MGDSRPKSGMRNNLDGRITKQLLKVKSGEFDIESIHSLVLRDSGINDLGCVGECVGLERLDLSQNDVTKLYALAGLTNLSHLNLSANRISSLDGLQALDNLKSLNIAGNLIGGASALQCLSCLENLTDLRLKDTVHDLSNPMSRSHTYKSDVLKVLPNLVTLDGERLSGKGSELFAMCEEIDNMIKEQAGQSSSSVVLSSGPWLPEGYLNKSNLAFENSNLSDAEHQLQALLQDCKRVSSLADEKMKSLQTKYCSAST